MHIGRSRSSKVVDFGTNRKDVCELLLVIYSNFGPILHRFWDTASYWLKIANFSYPTLIWRPRSGGTRQNFRMKLSAQKLEGWGYSRWKLHDPNFNRFWLIHPCDGRTDRRTDKRNCDSVCALSIYAVARKNGWTDLHEIFRGVEWPWDDLIKFGVNSGKRVGGSKVNFFVITGHSSEDWR